MTEMIERVARALFKMFRGVPPQGDAWRDYSEDAKSIIAEMRDPTIAMILSCADLPCSQQEMWKRSIEAALTDD